MNLIKILQKLKHPRNFYQLAVKEWRARREVGSRGSRAVDSQKELAHFKRNFADNLRKCTWTPHHKYSVFTQYDQSFYLAHKEEFLHKYKCFYAVARTIDPKRIIELGTHAGASADAYMSAAPRAEYFGFDQFETGVLRGAAHEVDGQPWLPMKVAEELFQARGFRNYQLIKADLRSLEKLPITADFVVVDAAHDFSNEYADLKLALTAEPTFIFVDDVDDTTGALPAVEKFVTEDLRNRLSFFCGIPYYGGGFVIKLRPDA